MLCSALMPLVLVGLGAPTDSTATLTATYREFGRAPGMLIRGADWSPAGPSLVMNDAGRTVVLDVGAGVLQSREVFAPRASQARWAPDGRWLLLETQTRDRDRIRRSSLTAVQADGTSSTAIVESEPVRTFSWGDDGFIYVWHQDSNERMKHPPPAVWLDTYRPPERVRPVLVHERVPGIAGTTLTAFWPGDPERSVRLPQHSALMVFVDAFPHDDRFLLRVIRNMEPHHDLVIGIDGEIITDYRDTKDLPHLIRNTISSDGRFIVAYDPKDDGHFMLSSQMYVIEVATNRRVVIENAPDGREPRLSKHGNLLAFDGLHGDDVHVGELEIVSR